MAFYEAAAKEAEASEHWTDLGRIFQNWANALSNVSQLDAAKATFLRSAATAKKVGSPRVKVIGAELEAFRIDVKQGKAVDVLPEVESRLDEIRLWWSRHRAGEDVAEAPDPEILGRALVSGLDIAKEACLALERWEDCLEILEETENAKRATGRGEQELAKTRFNRSGPLLKLERLDEAQQTLEDCLTVFRKLDDSVAEAAVLSGLADLWYRRGDLVQAVGLERQVLAVRNRLPDLADRSISHGNLSVYLDQSGATAEEARHLLARVSYDVLIDHQQHLQTVLGNLGIRIRHAADAGGRYELPRLADVLGRPEFSALKDVADRVDGGVDGLQAVVDQLVEGVRGEVAGAS